MIIMNICIHNVKSAKKCQILRPLNLDFGI